MFFEKWKDIKGFEGRSKISDLGRVKSLNYNNTNKEKILITKSKNQRYHKVTLIKNGKKKNYRVHRMVAESFIPNHENKDQINHIDGNRDNNKVCNLEWVTGSENMKHALSLGLLIPNTENMQKARIKKQSIKVAQINKNNEKIAEYNSIAEAQRETGIRHISCVTLGKRKSAGGYKWEKTNIIEGD